LRKKAASTGVQESEVVKAFVEARIQALAFGVENVEGKMETRLKK
jgi:hypothetical protein